MRASAVSFGLAILLGAGTASAEGLTLRWQAPGECPSESEVRAAALRNAREDAAALDADAVVERGPTWRVRLRTSRGGVTGERDLSAESCAALADATAVILALAMVAPDAPEEPTPPPAEAPAQPQPPRASTHLLALGAAIAVDSSTLPAAAAGGAASIAWTPERARVELGGSLWAGQSRTTGSSPAGAKLSLSSLGLRGCYAVVHGAVDVSPCLGADAMFVGAKGFGAAHNFDASANWIAASGGLLVRVPIASFLALRAQADGVVPLSRPTFVVEGDGDVHRPPSLGLRAAFGAELNFL